MAAKQLFRYFFNSPLQRDTVQALRETTGMRIREVGNPLEDTPGRGRFANGASMYLTRLEPEGTWAIDAFTHTPDELDIAAAAAMRSSLRRLLGRIADNWEEPYVDPALLAADAAQESGAAEGG